ncbi:PIN domain-containing protein [Alkaliphilus serpentinus]|uniref:DUF4935 domain-containing protein n=1 Tax=Alkaliphilus serpentinus TaxID=1482731 RepID=A0A833HM24_9FIRM|nr:PIN domain-containing protein [Alkaliphilus serpentinus]KAB3527071.1 hypothetical protein F8153_12900 [Alkaliphilus serpentinus]
MSFSSPNNYVIIFDTNILYEKAENGCNFCEFKFNRLFQNIVDEIEERDLIDHITIAIPDVTWNELYHQRIQAYNRKNHELEKLLEVFKFPHIQYEISAFDYEVYLNEQIDIFKKKLGNYSMNVISIDLPSETRFQSIVRRAFSKLPPFEGVDKKSDKGFKDALIWESVLEFKAKYFEYKVILYSRDGLFNDILAQEYNDLFKDNLILLNKEVDVIRQIAEVQKTVNQLRKINIDEVKYYDELRSLVSFELIKDVIFETELCKNFGSQIYDISDVRETEIKNVIETTENNSTEYINFEINIQLSLTFSNFEKEEDIDLENEEVIFYIEYSFYEKSFYITKVYVLENFYNLNKRQLGGGKFV